jgi:hypothetical protein
VIITLARKPLSEGSISRNVCVHGTGAINIDATRITTEDNLNGGAYANQGMDRSDGYENWRYKRLGQAGDFSQPTGRWPSNLIFEHSPECQLIGSKTVKTHLHYPSHRCPGGISTSGHRGQTGLREQKFSEECVLSYVCVSDCPVVDLDGQSGCCPVSGAAKKGSESSYNPKGSPGGMFGVSGGFPEKMPNDEGTASRYFKQIQADKI